MGISFRLYAIRPHLFLFVLLISLSIILPVNHAAAQRIPSDFDGDGVSELVLITIKRTLVWDSVDVTSGAAVDSKSIGVIGDQVIMADWLGLGKPQYGVTRVESGSGSVVWRVRDEVGLIRELHFGQAGDTVVAAADFDASGAADAVFVRKEGRKLHWFIHFDPFKGGTKTADFIFGTAREKIFFIDTDGLGVRFALLDDNAATTRVKLLNPVSGSRRVIKGLATERRRKGKLSVLPVQSSIGQQLIAMVRTRADKTVVTILNPEKRNRVAKKVKTFSIPSSGDVVAGNFLANPGFEIGVQSAAGVMVLNPFDGHMQENAAPGGVLVDEFNINRLLKNSNPAKPTTPDDKPDPRPTQPTSPPDAAPESLRSVCSSVTEVSPGEMLIKSQASPHINSGDARASGYTVVCGSQCPQNMSNVPFYFANGEQAGSVGYYGKFSGNGRPRLYGAASSAPQHFAKDIARRAAGIGNGFLYLQMGDGTCKSFSPIGRNGAI